MQVGDRHAVVGHRDALGAGLGSLTLDLCGAKAIWLSCLLLAVSFCLMFLKEDVEEIKEDLEALEAKH